MNENVRNTVFVDYLDDISFAKLQYHIILHAYKISNINAMICGID